MGGRVLTRPLKKLAGAALQVHSGDFDLERLPDSGPREVVTTTEAFNDMASTLKAVEAKAVALAAEDLSDPELLTPAARDGPATPCRRRSTPWPSGSASASSNASCCTRPPPTTRSRDSRTAPRSSSSSPTT